MFKNILLAFDGSDHAIKAARLAKELVELNQAELWLVVAYDPLPAYLGEPYMDISMDERLKYAREVLEAGVKELGNLPRPLRTEIIEGPPAEAILKVAAARQVDLIVMGTRGLGQLVGLLVGSQSQKVVSHAECPVLLVR